MSGFQFVHVESYSRKADAKGRSTGFVLDESQRKPGACEHVKRPGEPTVVYGVDLDVLRQRHDDQVADARAVTKAGQSKRIRNDQHTLLTCVASHPATSEQARNDPATAKQVADWQEFTLSWLRETWGDGVQCVVRHDDEAHVHLHAYVLPQGKEMRARVLHPGVVAKEQVKSLELANGADGKVANKLGDDAYKAAMRAMQDSFFERVGIPSGLARLGPGRRRLDRGAWKAEQAQVQHASAAIAAAVEAKAQVDQARVQVIKAGAAGREYVAAARQAAERAKAAADAAEVRRAAAEKAERAALARAAAEVRAARQQAAKTVQEARRTADRLRTIGGRLGGLWVGLVGVQRRLEARAAERVQQAEAKAQAEVVAVKQAAKASVAKARTEIDAKLGAELVAARRQAAEDRERAASAQRALEPAVKAKAEAEQKAAAERAARLRAEAERERFRGMWADADNKLQAGLRKGYR